MPFKSDELYKAYLKYIEFKKNNPAPFHDRYIFPLLAGSYFAYRKVDVMRIVAIAKSLSSTPSYLDVGCGYGDFLEKIREFIPTASGIEKDGNIFYVFQKEKPDYIHIGDIENFVGQFDLIFVGWMDPGIDFRKHVAKHTNCIVTTFDEGGQCGLNGGCDYEEFGFNRVAWWFTPSWIDVNHQLMNKYYTNINTDIRKQLFELRSAHNIWHVYTRDGVSKTVYKGLKSWIEREFKLSLFNEKFDFETILDMCGFDYSARIPKTTENRVMWDVKFDYESSTRNVGE
jgi:SAM-dependent methyltransferase